MWSLRGDGVVLLLLFAFTMAVVSLLLLLLQIYTVCFLRRAAHLPTAGRGGAHLRIPSLAGDSTAAATAGDDASVVPSLPELFCWKDGDEGPADCVVCLSSLGEGSVRVLPRCRHSFHEGCIGRWLVSHSVCCPICRTPVRAPDPAPPATAMTSPPATAAAAFLRTDEEVGVVAGGGHVAARSLVLLDGYQLGSEFHLPLLLC